MTTPTTHNTHAPPDQPPQRWTAPALWARARQFIAAMFADNTSAHALISRPRLAMRERNAILNWLLPAERLVRQLLLTDAITFLLMTPEGRRLRRNARPITPPAPPPPPPPPFGTTRMLTIPLNANLAKHVSYRPKPIPRPPADPHDPQTWRTSFAILRWTDGPTPSAPPPPRINTTDRPQTPPNYTLARRIESLRRTLANTRARMLRAARYLARLPRGLLGLPSPHLFRFNRPITTLLSERMALFALADSAVEALNSS